MSMPKQKDSNNPSRPTLFIPIPVHLLPPLFCPISISSAGTNQIWKLFQLKSISHQVFLLVGGFLLGWMHIKIPSKKKLTRLFTSLVTHLHCHSFVLVQRYNTAPQNLKTNCKKILRRHKKNPNPEHLDFCLLGSLKFTSLCSSSLSSKAGVCSTSSQAHWCK